MPSITPDAGERGNKRSELAEQSRRSISASREAGTRGEYGPGSDASDLGTELARHLLKNPETLLEIAATSWSEAEETPAS